LSYVYNFLGMPPEQHFESKKLTPGKHVFGMEFIKEKAGEHGESMGSTKLYVDGDIVAEGPMRAQAADFGLSGTGLVVGRNDGDAVSSEYTAPFPFEGGKVLGIEISLG